MSEYTDIGARVQAQLDEEFEGKNLDNYTHDDVSLIYTAKKAVLRIDMQKTTKGDPKQRVLALQVNKDGTGTKFKSTLARLVRWSDANFRLGGSPTVATLKVDMKAVGVDGERLKDLFIRLTEHVLVSVKHTDRQVSKNVGTVDADGNFEQDHDPLVEEYLQDKEKEASKSKKDILAALPKGGNKAANGGNKSANGGNKARKH